MSLAQSIFPLYTIDEYLRFERDAADKHEYRQGRILDRAGGSPAHSLVIANVIREVGNKLKDKPCRVYESNLRVLIPRKFIYTYPDASILCEPPRMDPRDRGEQTVMNPRAIIEVLSPSTEAYDRGQKFESYRWLDSLREYILISQNAPRIETFLRQEDGSWLFRAWAGLDSAAFLRSVEVELPLIEVYAGVEFPPVEEPPEPQNGPEEIPPG